MKEPIIQGIFPCPVMFSKLERSLSDKEIAAFNHFGKDVRSNEGNTTSVDNYVLKHKDFKPLKSFIQSHIDAYVKKVIIPKTKVELYITQSWINYTKAGQFHHVHTHPNSVISGVFYINATQGDKITFSKQTTDMILEFETDDFQLFNSKSWYFEVNTNDIVLFPSTLQHRVETLDQKKTDVRISLAFNTFLKGHVGDNRNLTELII
jgi:uncharacterized protein (TIGR02466 family)